MRLLICACEDQPLRFESRPNPPHPTPPQLYYLNFYKNFLLQYITVVSQKTKQKQLNRRNVQ